jgi:error-prone DNA polymerase
MQVAMLAAGFTAGEADNLRRSMAAWKRKGGLGKYYDKIVTGMTTRGYDKTFAEQIFHQIEGFGEYGFPESHAASFALLAYASGWLKCHEPAAYLAALLNSQPMGFYSRSTLVQDARRHGVRVLPVDVANSNWEATLHYPPSGRPAVRLGMNQVKGMSRASAQRIEQARKQHPLAGIADLARRARLSRRDLAVLAAADALRPLTGHRRAALWHTAPPPQPDLFAAACSSSAEEEKHPELAPMTEGQSIVADYRSLGLTLGRHPLALLRGRLSAMRFLCSAQLRGQPDRRLVRACGIVTVRQRPQTAKGMVFITLEDETGQVNLVVRPDIARRQPREMRQAQLLGAYGTWQACDGVQNLLVARLVDLTSLLGRLQTTSRDFH